MGQFNIEQLKNDPERQIEYLNSSFEQDWANPENIREAVNQVAAAQGRSEKLQSSDLQDIIQFAKKLGFDPVIFFGV